MKTPTANAPIIADVWLSRTQDLAISFGSPPPIRASEIRSCRLEMLPPAKPDPPNSEPALRFLLLGESWPNGWLDGPPVGPPATPPDADENADEDAEDEGPSNCASDDGRSNGCGLSRSTGDAPPLAPCSGSFSESSDEEERGFALSRSSVIIFWRISRSMSTPVRPAC